MIRWPAVRSMPHARLDFLDERDRKTLEQYRAAVEQFNVTLARRAPAREALEELAKE